MKTKKLTYSALLTAIGVIAGNFLYIPVGASKCFPVQSVINVLGGIILGPTYGVIIAFGISLIRNILGTGTLLAFPGSMLGALLAGLLYKYTKNDLMAVLGEIVGTGIIGALVAYPIAALILGKKVAALFFVIPFSVSAIGGGIIAFIIIKFFDKTKILRIRDNI